MATWKANFFRRLKKSSQMWPVLENSYFWQSKEGIRERSRPILSLMVVSSFSGAWWTIVTSCLLTYLAKTWSNSGGLHSWRLSCGPASTRILLWWELSKLTLKCLQLWCAHLRCRATTSVCTPPKKWTSFAVRSRSAQAVITLTQYHACWQKSLTLPYSFVRWLRKTTS